MTPLPGENTAMGKILTACKPMGTLCIAEVDGRLYLRAIKAREMWEPAYYTDMRLTTPQEDAKREADRIIEQERGFVRKLGAFYHKKGKGL